MFEAYAQGFGLITALSALFGLWWVNQQKSRSSEPEKWVKRERLVRAYVRGVVVVYLLLLAVSYLSGPA
ncbi:MAG: hypothetical protein HWE12_02705 [Oceanospirillaceae bacterium]|nr:hypothetical protein [Oceanospirillaceae bacterium]